VPLRVQLFGTAELPPQQLPTETPTAMVRMDRAAQPNRVDLAHQALAEHLGVADELIALPDQPGIGLEIDQISLRYGRRPRQLP
jgi:L-alanine-DL-glutamate epimerase-like enolase superfamily enzyme